MVVGHKITVHCICTQNCERINTLEKCKATIKLSLARGFCFSSVMLLFSGTFPLMCHHRKKACFKTWVIVGFKTHSFSNQDAISDLNCPYVSSAHLSFLFLCNPRCCQCGYKGSQGCSYDWSQWQLLFFSLVVHSVHNLPKGCLALRVLLRTKLG